METVAPPIPIINLGPDAPARFRLELVRRSELETAHLGFADNCLANGVFRAALN